MKQEKKSWIARLLSMVDTWGEILILVLIYLTYVAVTSNKDLELIELLLKYDLYLVLAVGGVKAVPPGALVSIVQSMFKK